MGWVVVLCRAVGGCVSIEYLHMWSLVEVEVGVSLLVDGFVGV